MGVQPVLLSIERNRVCGLASAWTASSGGESVGATEGIELRLDDLLGFPPSELDLPPFCFRRWCSGFPPVPVWEGRSGIIARQRE